jgi:transcriptional regulator of acetoin/glycerol metabolism
LPPPTPARLEDAERDVVLRAMKAERGNLASAARALGISRSTLYRKLARYGLETTDGP